MLLDDLVDLVGQLLGLADAPAVRPGADDDRPPDADAIADPAPSALAVLSDREALAGLWAEVEQLPVRQRLALLLNLRDDEGHGVIALLPVTGIASIRSIATMLEMPASELATLWPALPLDDAAIAERLGLTRQQVINLRKSARARLGRKMRDSVGRPAVTPPRFPAHRECAMSDHPSPDALRRYRAGDLPPAELLAVDAHLEGCAECLAQSPATTGTVSALRAALATSRAGHLDYEQDRSVRGRHAGGRRAEAVESHLGGCKACSEDVGDLRRVRVELSVAADAAPAIAAGRSPWQWLSWARVLGGMSALGAAAAIAWVMTPAPSPAPGGRRSGRRQDRRTAASRPSRWRAATR